MSYLYSLVFLWAFIKQSGIAYKIHLPFHDLGLKSYYRSHFGGAVYYFAFLPQINRYSSENEKTRAELK